MRAKLLLNDVHLGAQRVGGTTPRSAMMIREYLLSQFRAMLMAHLDKDAVINGDLCDAFLIALVDALGLHEVLREWLLASAEPKDLCDDGLEHAWQGGQVGGDLRAYIPPRCANCMREPVASWSGWVPPSLFAGMGNHDASKDTNKLSTFRFILRLLQAEFGNRVVVIDEPWWIELGLIYMIPHMPNQDLFNLELERAAALPGPVGRLLLLHANYDNGYTVESDHSLNVSQAQALKLIDAGWRLVFGHEHQARNLIAMGGTVSITNSLTTDIKRTETTDWGVIIAGNQWPSSVADCLNNPHGKKHAHIIRLNETLCKDHQASLDLEPIETWDAESDFAEIEWQELGVSDATARFVRVIGKATAEQAADVIAAISKYRQAASDVFVVTNAVVVEGAPEMAEIAQSVETLKAFDVWSYLLEQLDEDQRKAVEALRSKYGMASLQEAA